MALDRLNRWREEAIQNINSLYEFKKEKLDLLLRDNEEIFAEQIADHLKALDALKIDIMTHVKEEDVTFEELRILKGRLKELDNCVNKTHNRLVYSDIKPILTDYTWVLLHSTGTNYMNGGTLLCTDYQMKLNDFYGKATQKWQLIYKATKDGFDGKDFHRCVDNKGSTMTIIQSAVGDYLFGGYAEISWTSDGQYKVDPAAFIFTLTNPHGIQPTKFFQRPDHHFAVAHTKTDGPYFGGVVKDKQHFVDIQIVDNAQRIQNSHSNFPASYLDTTNKGETLFTGTKKFLVKEIEVYQCCSEPSREEMDADEPNEEGRMQTKRIKKDP